MIPRLLSELALAALLWAGFTRAFVYDFGRQGCYSTLNGWEATTNKMQNTPGLCGQQCQDKGMPLFALSGEQCLCGSELPPSFVQSSSGSCDTKCPYDPNNNCGTNGVYLIYNLGDSAISTAATSLYSSVAPTSSATSAGTSTSASPTTSTSAASSTSSTESSSSPTSSSSATSSSTESARSTSAAAASSAGHSRSAVPSSTAAASSHASSSAMAASATSSRAASSSTQSDASSTSAASSTQSSASPTSSATPLSTSVASGDNSKKRAGGGLSGGAIAGIVVGVVVGVLAIAAAILGFIIWRRRRERDDYYSPQGSPTKFKNDIGVFNDPYPPQPPRPLVDPRLNPTMLGDPRISIASLADARDYSRQVLTVTNPDEKM